MIGDLGFINGEISVVNSEKQTKCDCLLRDHLHQVIDGQCAIE